MIKQITFILLALMTQQVVSGQQVANKEYSPELKNPAYPSDEGPLVVVDDAHFNFHTADGRYHVFADLMRRDGYRVEGLNAKRFDRDSLRSVGVLVIVNALNERNVRDWSLPTPSAFLPEEIDAVKDWVRCGGSLFLVADHMPFPGAANDLAAAFGVTFSNGYARPGHRVAGRTDTFDGETGLIPSFLTNGRSQSEKVDRIATFGGSAFVPPAGSTPVILFDELSVSQETTRAPGITTDAKEVSVHGWCQGAAFQHGCGRVVVFGEAAMFTAQTIGANKRPMGMNAPEAAQNHQLLLNVMHWLSRLY